MNWVRGDDYHIKSDPPGYTITRCLVFGGYRYEVWRNRMHVSTHYESAAAKAAAHSHRVRFEAGETV